MKFNHYLTFILFPLVIFSQEEPSFPIYFNEIPATDAIVVLEKTYSVKISYPNKLIDGKTVSLKNKKRTLNEVLNELALLLDIKFKVINQRYIVVNKADNDEINLQQLKEIVINEYLTRGITKNIDATFKIEPKKLDILPGLIEADVLESIQELPGVISPNETATGLNVRGGTPDQNQIIWDGINIYHNGHLFGMVSSFNPNITHSITFYNKGTNPRFGERISSAIDITTTNNIAKKANLGAGFNGISADAFIETPIVQNKLSLLAAFRKSYENLYETSTFKKIEQKVFQNSSILDNEYSEEKFHFKDYNLKLNYKPNKRNSLSASLIHIDNDLQHDYQSPNKNKLNQDFIDTENNGYSLNWSKNWNDNVTQNTKLSYSYYALRYDYTTIENQNQTLVFNKANQIKDYVFSTEVSILNKNNNKFNFGYQTSFKKVNYVFMETTDSPYILDKNNSKINTNSLFANYSGRQSESFNFDIGVRANYYNQLNALRLEPRLLIIKNLNNNIKIQASGEIKNQVIYQIDETLLSDLSLENKLWRLSDGNEAPIINSKHVTLGLLYNNNGWSFDFDIYHKKIKGISSLFLGFYNEDNSKYFKGNQRVYGVDFYAKKDFNMIKTWISYSINKTDNIFDDINNENYFTASNEINHAISTSITYKTKRLQIAFGWKWHSGKPYTLTNTNTNDNSISFKGINTERLPCYHRLDVSSVYNFFFSKESAVKGKIGFSILNLYNKKNFLSKEFTGNNIPNEPIVMADYYSLHLTPNFLFRVYW